MRLWGASGGFRGGPEGAAAPECSPGAVAALNYTCTADGTFSPTPDHQTLCRMREFGVLSKALEVGIPQAKYQSRPTLSQRMSKLYVPSLEPLRH